ncbi:MAG: sensor domain-containing diguanylate cyclase [Acidobacteriaceae bacterium]|nr:sensor domain-containing diguanylate cyclase [Acidobacteriaceae bacterium]
MSQNDSGIRLVAEYSVDTMIQLGADHIIRYASPACESLLGYTPDEMVGLVPERDLIDPRDMPALERTRERVDHEGATETRTVMRWRRKDGSTVWVETRTRVLREPDTNAVRELVIAVRDISEQKKLEEQLALMALTDGLTGLANRRAFDERLEHEWQRTLRNGHPTSLLLIDLDHFKKLNDRYGHQVGDDCLRATARCIDNQIRRGMDFTARYGGEELAAILPEIDFDGAIHVAQTICQAVAALRIPHPDNVEGNGMVSISVGVATALSRCGGSMRMPESLLVAADSALYKAKHLGRNRAEGALLLTPAA